MKQIIKVVTPVGTFTRVTETSYKFAKVWSAPRFTRYANTRASVGKPGQWHKDHGYDVTWHLTREAADRTKNKWSDDAVCVGIFPVTD